MNTIETTNHKIRDKMSKIKLIMEKLQDFGSMLDSIGNSEYKDALSGKCIYLHVLPVDFEELEYKYNLSVVNVLNEYYTEQNTYNEDELTKEYYRIISSENFASRLDEYMIICRSAFTCMTRGCSEELEPYVDELNKLMRICGAIQIVNDVKKQVFDQCICGAKMVVLPESSELFCEDCSLVKTLCGTPFEDVHVYSQDGGAKSKSCIYDPNRHLKFWLERLQAKERKEISERDLKKIEYYVKRDNPDLTNVYVMRMILKEAKLTKYNDHAPLLMKLITGVSPPSLSINLQRRISARFNRIMEWLDILRRDDGNRPYYPHFIYKTFEDEYDVAIEEGRVDDAEVLRRLQGYIHLQSMETIGKHDILYKEICERDAEMAVDRAPLTFRPTQPPDI